MNKTILIVDDVTLNIDALKSILMDDYSIMVALSGESAIKLINRRRPDLVLLDVYMPGIDGFGVLQYMKKFNEFDNIPVIFVTGEHDPNTEEKGLEMGAVDYIKKPYNGAVVKAKVKNHLELKAYRDNLELLVNERTKELDERRKQLEESTRQLAASHEAIIMGMSLMSESHDDVTGKHIERIKTLTKILSSKILELYPDLMTADMADKIALFSPLHDVGKVCIPDKILKKMGPLFKDEFDVMKTHTLHAADLLRKTECFLPSNEGVELNVAIEIAESHHEKYDGTGYPHGLKGMEIPLSARIVSVADVYDALRSDRPYKRAFSHEEAVDIILSGDEKTTPEQFDPMVLEVFCLVSDEFNKTYEAASD